MNYKKILFRLRNHYLSRVFRENRRLFFALLIVAVMPVTVASVSLYFLQTMHELYDFRDPLTAIAFFSLTTLTMSLAMTPTTFIAIIAGHFFSWTGLVGVVTSYLFASVLGLLLGLYLRKTFIGKDLMKRPEIRTFFSSLGHREFLLVVFGRLSPVLPFAMMNIAFAHMKLQWKYYLSGSLIGMFPRTFLFFWTGMYVQDLWNFLRNPQLDGLLQLIPVILVIISTVGIIWVVKSALKSFVDKETS